MVDFHTDADQRGCRGQFLRPSGSGHGHHLQNLGSAQLCPGEMALIATYVAYMLLEQYQFPSYLAFPLSLVFAVVLGCVLEFTVLRRAKDPPFWG